MKLLSVALAGAITAFSMHSGLLTTVVGFISFGIYSSLPLRIDPEAWYSHSGFAVLALTIIAALLCGRASTKPLT